MQESDIHGAISASIPRLKEMQIKPEFELLKAVGPKLVSVPEIKELIREVFLPKINKVRRNNYHNYE